MPKQHDASQLTLPMQEFAIVDVETTGTIHDGKITEIAIIVHNGLEEKERFTTLLNPCRRIDPYVVRLTGITDRMVADAPLFEEFAERILRLTENRVFVGHNVSFDYGFLKMEFKRLGIEFKRDTIDTIDICRRIIPDLPSYSLGNLCKSIGIDMSSRHRALGDTEATALLFERLYRQDSITVLDRIKPDLPNIKVPPNLPPSQLQDIPETAGVYYFHDGDGQTIYIGKSIDLRKRILTHFNPNEKKKWAELWKNLHSISYEETGSELVALLLEAQEIKRQQPRLNIQRREMWQLPYSVFEGKDEQGYVTFSVRKRDSRDGALLDLRSYKEGERLLIHLAKRHGLCQCLMGLNKLSGHCFQMQIHACQGARQGLEPAEQYNRRAGHARQSMSFSAKNLLIIDKGRHAEEYSAVQVEDGRYMGYGFIPAELASEPLESLLSHIRHQEDSRDAQRLIHAHLHRNRQLKRIPYAKREDGSRQFTEAAPRVQSPSQR